MKTFRITVVARQERTYEVKAVDAAAARRLVIAGDAGDPEETDHDWSIDDVEEIEPEDAD